MNGKFFRNGIVMLVLVVGTVLLLYTFLVSPTNETPKPYSDYLADVRAGLVTNVTQQDLTLTVTTAGSPASKYITIQPGLGIPSALQETGDAAKAGGQDPNKIKFTALKASDAGQWVNLLVGALLPVLLIGGFLFFMMRQAQGPKTQELPCGLSRARMSLCHKPGGSVTGAAGAIRWKRAARGARGGPGRALGGAVLAGAYALDVRVPAALVGPVGVGDRGAE